MTTDGPISAIASRLRAVGIGAALVAAILCAYGCGETDRLESDRWNFEDKGKRVKQGIYRLEIDVKEDTCEPGLDDLIKKADGHPPKYGLILLTSPAGGAAPDPSNPGLTFRRLMLRAGEWRSDIGARLTKSRLPRNYPAYSRKLSHTPRSGDYVRCVGGDSVRVRITSPAPDRMRVSVRARWPDVNRCKPDFGSDPSWLKRAWPEKDCREHYVMTYSLVHHCPLRNRCQVKGNRAAWGCRRYDQSGRCQYYNPPIKNPADLCVCQDPD